jgi:two-component system, cell cycle response regulator DivK
MTASTSHRRVLIAEDHEDSREALRTLLEALGYDVAVAANGREAVDEARRQRPDLILMDVMMPEMDGLEATRRLKASAELAGIPVVAVSAMEGATTPAREAGCAAHVRKPIDIPRFIAQLPAWIDEGEPPH